MNARAVHHGDPMFARGGHSVPHGSYVDGPDVVGDFVVEGHPVFIAGQNRGTECEMWRFGSTQPLAGYRSE